MTARAPLETDYVHALLARATLEFRGVRFFRRNTGLLKLHHYNAKGERTDRVFRASIPGQCDLWAVRKGDARHYEIEVKRFGELEDTQKIWRAWCVEYGVPWLLLRVHKLEREPETIARWIGELRAFLV
jgi:hypothetical protein